jgi:redox-sensitive bicupin YhaK (pirin superfamily)
VSGPVEVDDAPLEPDDPAASAEAGASSSPQAGVEVLEGRRAQVGSLSVRRVLPRRARRTVGAWCFADHMGPVPVSERDGVEIGPHPHMGLQTVTWLVAGEVLHRDTLGSEQVVRAGQLNLMTAGRGVAHSEENTGAYRGDLHGIQLWVAQPDRTRNGAAAFEHHTELPRVELDAAVVTVVVGEAADRVSPARRDTDHMGADLELRRPGATLPLRSEYEHALVVLEGRVGVDGASVVPGVLAYLGTGRDECRFEVHEPARALLLGGVPFAERLVMWWNFVARDEEEVSLARHEWSEGGERFGTVRSPLGRVEAPVPVWERRGS